MKKSYVAMEKAVCPVCGKLFETGCILMDCGLQNSLDAHGVVTHYEPCDECNKMLKEYIACIVVLNSPDGKESISVEDAERTGEVLWLKRETAWKLFGMSEEQKDTPCVFIDTAIADKLKEANGAQQ